MKKNNIFIIIMVVIGTMFLLVGCKPKGDPKEVLNAYYSDIKDGNVEEAYEKLCSKSKENFSKEDFIKWQETMSEYALTNKVTLEELNSYKEKTIDEIEFKNVVEFNVKENTKDLRQNKDVNIDDYTRYVIDDNGEWKLYRGKENGKELVADSLSILADMYSNGEGGKTENINEAIKILNEALKYDSNKYDIYYSLSTNYYLLNRYDDAKKAINIFLEKATLDEEKSNAYNVQGLLCQSTNKIDDAKEYFKKAIQLDENNEHAKTNLARLEQY